VIGDVDPEAALDRGAHAAGQAAENLVEVEGDDGFHLLRQQLIGEFAGALGLALDETALFGQLGDEVGQRCCLQGALLLHRAQLVDGANLRARRSAATPLTVLRVPKILVRTYAKRYENIRMPFLVFVLGRTRYRTALPSRVRYAAVDALTGL
jgi:hypothetical protein